MKPVDHKAAGFLHSGVTSKEADPIQAGARPAALRSEPIRHLDTNMSQWSHLYNDVRWRKLRARQLRDEPLCRMCDARGLITAATVCDHVEPHKGDIGKFWSGPFQSLCKQCHDSDKQRIENGGKPKPVFGLDGWPVG